MSLDERVKLKIKDTHGVALSIVLDKDFVQMDRGGTRYTEGGSLRRRTLKRSKIREFDLLVDGSATGTVRRRQVGRLHGC